MNITITDTIGNAKPGKVRAYRSNPSDFTIASQAAAHYAAKNGERMIVVPGNSYGRAVFHIARESDPISKFGALSAIRVAVVEMNGTVHGATAA